MPVTRRPKRDRRAPRGPHTAVLTLALIASAYLMSVAIGYGGYPWIGWLALFPLFVSIRVQRPWRAMLSGALWGALLYLFLSMGGRSCVRGAASFLLLTGVPGAFALLLSALSRRVGFSPLMVGVGWAFAELALSPLRFRAGLLGATQSDGLVLSVIGNSLGYVSIGFVAAFVGALLVTVLENVRLPVGAPRPPLRTAHRPTVLFPQTVTRLPRFNLQPGQPRAPPLSRAFSL